MERLCVFCGANSGRSPAYVVAAKALGQALASNEVGLVYGGTNVGLMAAVANATLDAGGDAIGVIPDSIHAKGLVHEGLTDVEVVDSIHVRKKRMVELADGCVALPGGYGTVEELLEVMMWIQLGVHDLPCGFLNTAGYFDPLIGFFDHAHREGFVSEKHRDMITVATDPEEILEAFAGYEPTGVREYLA